MNDETKKNILLILPNYLWFNDRPWYVPPYTLGLLAASLRDDFNVHILDANHENLSFAEFQERVAAIKPWVVGISCQSIEYSKGIAKTTELVKTVDSSIHTVLGGAFSTISPEIAIEDKNLDFIILAEGERRFPQFLHELLKEEPDFSGMDGIVYRENQDYKIKPVTGYIENLDLLPFPAYDMFDYSAYSGASDRYSHVLSPRYFPYAMTSTSRGCPFKCVFCCTESIYGSSIRYQTAERVLKEIDWLVGEYGIKEIIFLDDNLVLDRKRFVQILEGLIKRDYDLHWKSVNLATFALDNELLELMVESGTYQLLLPVESGNQHVLTNLLRKPLRLEKVPGIVKKAKELGLETQAGFIIGTPGETWDQIRDTFRFAEQLDVDMVVFHVATPLPRTHLTQMAIDHGALPADFSFHPDHFFGFGKGVLTTDEFTPELLQMARALEWDRINFPTLEKRKRFIKIAGISLEELEDWRKQTLRKAGIYFPGKAEENVGN